MSIDALNKRVTEAILRAEALEVKGPSIEVSRAYLDVSFCEEEIAAHLPVSDEEGAIARRGAVRAALTAGQPTRAKDLADRYAAEGDAPSDLVKELERMAAQAEAAPGLRAVQEVLVVSAARYRFHHVAA